MSLLIDYVNCLSNDEKFLINKFRLIQESLPTPIIEMNWAILLNGHVYQTDAIVCTLWLARHPDTRIAYSNFGKIQVSTVFCTTSLGSSDLKPQHFETMVFSSDTEELSRRYSIYSEALRGHADIARQFKTHGSSMGFELGFR